jgi:hypothetical protein
MGRRGIAAWVPTAEERAQVEHFTSTGYTQTQIAALLGKSTDSLQRHCREELNLGGLKANARVAGKLYEKCMEGDTASLIFWAKTRLGWRETQKHEHSGPDGTPMRHQHILHLSNAELIRIIEGEKK